MAAAERDMLNDVISKLGASEWSADEEDDPDARLFGPLRQAD